MADDWFRSPDWDSEAQEEFERRLRRARAWNRPQLLRIKGTMLQRAGLEGAAEELWLRVLHEYPEDGDAVTALEQLADLARVQGKSAVAAGYYRELLRREPSLNGTSGMAHVSLAELLLEDGRPESLEEAGELLEEAYLSQQEHWFNDGKFRLAVACAVLAEHLGDTDVRRDYARAALSLATEPSEVTRHPGVGVVRPDEDLLHRLWMMAK